MQDEEKTVNIDKVDEEEVKENKEPMTSFSKFWLWMCIVLFGLIIILSIIIKLLG